MADQKIERLRQVPMFAGADKKGLNELATAVDSIDVDAGKTLFRKGAVQHEAFIIESGTAEVLIDGVVVAEIPEGEMIGEIGLLTRSPATATVTAKTPMTLLMIPHQRFHQVLENSPGLAIGIAKELAERLRATDEKLS